jgi:hypothetical protein
LKLLQNKLLVILEKKKSQRSVIKLINNTKKIKNPTVIIYFLLLQITNVFRVIVKKLIKNTNIKQGNRE